MATRRSILKLAATGLAATALPALPAGAASAGRRHGLSIFGDLAYPADFSAFRYVDPAAPKGGRLVLQPPNWMLNQDTQTFDTLNTLVLKGSAPPRMEITFDTLMVRALDEPDAVYGLIAESVEVSEDGNSYLFHLRPEARFHDGSPITAEDVAFTYNLIRSSGHPALAEGLRDLVNAEAIDATMVELTFSGAQSISAALEATVIPVLSRADVEARDFQAATLQPLLGSGAYRVGRFEAGRFIEYERVADYWGAGLAVNAGKDNFDILRIDFFRERQAELEALKKGEIDWRQESSSKAWSTEYTFPAVTDGRVKLAEFATDARPAMQGWFLNLRRPRFADVRTREALDLAFDFEWTNANLFYGLYRRQHSFFQKSDFMADGEPSADERALLEGLGVALPDGCLGPAVLPAVSDGSGRDRGNLRRASELLSAAGWTREGARLVDASGVPFTIEFLIEASVFERILAPYAEALKALGIEASIRLVESAQYQNRLRDFDFDVVGAAFSLSATPVESLDAFFAGRLATTPGSYNLSGIADPAVDALVEKAGRATTRAELVTVARALDRVLRALRPWIPNWYSSVNRVAYWDRFGLPEGRPAYGYPVERLWWARTAS